MVSSLCGAVQRSGGATTRGWPVPPAKAARKISAARASCTDTVATSAAGSSVPAGTRRTAPPASASEISGSMRTAVTGAAPPEVASGVNPEAAGVARESGLVSTALVPWLASMVRVFSSSAPSLGQTTPVSGRAESSSELTMVALALAWGWSGRRLSGSTPPVRAVSARSVSPTRDSATRSASAYGRGSTQCCAVSCCNWPSQAWATSWPVPATVWPSRRTR